MDRLETEVQHMLRMLAPPFFDGWKDEIERKAKDLEADPDFAGLWGRIKAEVAARGWHKKPAASSAGAFTSSSSSNAGRTSLT